MKCTLFSWFTLATAGLELHLSGVVIAIAGVADSQNHILGLPAGHVEEVNLYSP